QLVQDHAIILETETPLELGISGHFLLIDLTIREDRVDFAQEVIGLLHVAFVQLEVHLQRLVRNATQTAELELFRLIDSRLFLHLCLLNNRGPCVRSVGARYKKQRRTCHIAREEAWPEIANRHFRLQTQAHVLTRTWSIDSKNDKAPSGK